ncbi:hypothetical protein D187_003816 [Cystobacter fuscus DSM 2262]|uniref:Uncharacterized protein n=1 Tax=Cystobacter fuscus (strain ATCC 25194 / DSM 2262 / NBRC 100088 / M29) TaxID=1242864 RepID=S9QPW9_CYSF2|nr:Ig-like domain-containing protein [Cystobacter fuscus]EPX58618.1 hypothetical protein D187_003816 [Cystobacter fuscus DSM 2262]
MLGQPRRWMLGVGLAAALVQGCGGDELEVEFLSPAERTETRGDLGIALTVTGGAPDRVDLYVNDGWLATIGDASYRWDTTGWPEGEYTLEARAWIGEQVYKSEPRKVRVDRTAPLLLTTFPSRGEPQVPVKAAPIALKFSEPLTTSALGTLTLRLNASGGGTQLLSPSGLSEDRKTLFFPAHSMNITPPQTIAATLMGRAEDPAGNSFLSGNVDSAWAWQVPVFIPLGEVMGSLLPTDEPPLLSAQGPTLSLNSEGRPLVSWRASSSSVVVRNWDGQGWKSIPSKPFPASDLRDVGADIALDESGIPTVGWISRDANSSSISVWSHQGDDWARQFTVGPNPEGPFPLIDRAALRLSKNGTARLAWLAGSKTAPGFGGLMIYWRGPTEDTSFFNTYSQGTALLGRHLAMETNTTLDSLALAWSERVDNGYRLMVIRRQDYSYEWSEWPMQARDALPGNPSLVLQSNGEPIVAWNEPGAIQVRRLKGNTWTAVGTPIPIPSTVDVTSVVPVLALDNTEQPVLAWSMPGKAEVWRWNGSAWMRVGELNQPVSGETSSPWPLQLQVEKSGTPVVGWLRPDANQPGRGVMEVYQLNR